jgi:hypothetical protein
VSYQVATTPANTLIRDLLDGHSVARETAEMPNVTCQNCHAEIINVPTERIGKGMTVTCPACHTETSTLPTAEEIMLMRLERIDRKVGFVYRAAWIFVALLILIALVTAMQIWVSWRS